MTDTSMIDTSPAQQTLLSPGEVIRTSGKFPKPTKIPGKNYSKDEVVIRNSDSGKGKPQTHIIPTTKKREKITRIIYLFVEF